MGSATSGAAGLVMSTVVEKAPSPPFFSVCVPTYNRGHSLAESISSVLGQDFRDFELLICDNASTDRTQEVVRSFADPRLRSLHWPELVSMYANHNRCVDEARGQWIVFLHSDDVFPPNYLSRLCDEIDASERAEIICNAQYSDEHKLALRLGDNDPLTVMSFTVLMNGHSPSGTAYKREGFFKHGKFDEESLVSDGVILVQWAAGGALLRLFDSHPKVWQQRAESALGVLQLQPDFFQQVKPILDAAYHSPRAQEFRDHLHASAPLLPPRFQARLICRHYQCGYRREANELWRNIGGIPRLYRQRDFYVHLLPLRYAPGLYWPFMKTVRKARLKYRQRFKQLPSGI